LASSLGAVELTVAIHRVFNTAQDRLVFDVGHQCYAHKVLTGRRDAFSTLRQFGGLSGFPKPYESEHDAFVAGHASNSVSVALGMARARTLKNGDYHVLAMIGDGAMTGGLAYEGLNDAGAAGEPMIVILNDNGMSINPNVGALPHHLASLRSQPGYYRLKKQYRKLLGKGKAGIGLYRFGHKVKQTLKKAFFPGSTLFEDMGFIYMGPVDGHDLETLIHMLTWAKEEKRPVLLHVHTVKGKGYSFAEADPGKFHGIGPFSVETGEVLKKESTSFSSEFGRALCEFAADDPRLCAITAAMTSGTGLDGFAHQYPERFFDVGIAEGHAVAMAGGLAKQGMLPVFAVYSSFLQRGFDQLIHDVALGNLHVVFGVDRAGLVGADGETHHGTFDALYFSEIPGMTVFCPANYAELRSMLRSALYEVEGPAAVRYPRGGEGAFCADTSAQAIARLREGKDITLMGYGMTVNHLLAAADKLEEKGIFAEVLKINAISPLDTGTIVESVRRTKHLLVAEDCCVAGCVGQRIGAILAQYGVVPERLILKNLGKNFVPQGTVSELERCCGLDADGIVQAVLETCR
ncbi:MAG: 1-deoxy-D-xylulose-5-phosphate synthase, partial [Oscillospiraceae bacterium]|nr:1-deoxy-D-xylulose-5-phosphate synthase [Oscillospiraceae bacterium]